MPKICSTCLPVLVLVALIAAPSLALRDPADPSLPPDFDRRLVTRGAEAPGVAPLTRATASALFAGAFGEGVRMHWGEWSDRPQLVFRPGGVLETLDDFDAKEPLRSVRRFLTARSGLFGLSPDEIGALETVKLYRTRGTDLTHVVLGQRVGGLSVFEGRISLHVDPSGGIVNIGNDLHAGLREGGAPDVTPESALAVAARGIGLSGSVPPVVASSAGPDRRTVFAGGGEYLEPPGASLVVVPRGAGRSSLAWDIRVWENVTGWSNLYQVLVDAATGEPLLRRRLTLFVVDPSESTGNVFEQDPSIAGRVVVSFAGDPAGSPANWVTAAQTYSVGNNVQSRSDRAGDNNDIENPEADGGDALDFDFRFRDDYASRGRIGDEEAAIANGFYFGNLFHDHYYALGFDEVSGNFQVDNYGLGGLGGDHVNIDVQDSWNRQGFLFRNNANWSPTADGSPARTQYYLFTEPNRDSAFDGDVFFHEFSHGLSTRLVGGPGSVCLSGPQPGGMGEGWGDFQAVSFFSDAADDPAGPVAVGEYVTGDTTNGIRRYPYAYDMAIDPLTYDDLCDNGSCAVHDEGEIWATVLWDARHDLILAHGFTQGVERIEQVVVDAMKLSPCNPNMVQMKDLVIQASTQRYGSQDVCTLRSAFARRGLGASAASVGTGSNATAAFDVTARLDATLSIAGDKETLTWGVRAGALGYPVGRGTMDGAAPSNSFDDAACLGEAAGPSFQDADTPAAGSGYFYLVSVRDDCATADFGTGSDGTLRTVASCL